MPVDAGKAADTWLRYQYIRDNGHLDYVQKAKRCEDFFAGLQWDANDLALLRQYKRPALTINKILSTISNVLGEQIFNRTQIAFRPRNEGATQELADTLSKVFMQISDNNQLEWARSDVFADGIIGSRGFYDVRLGFGDSMRGEVELTQLNPKNVLIDPDAEEYDPDKWGDVFLTKWMSPDQIELLYNKGDADELRGTDTSFLPYGYDSLDSERDRFGDPRAVSYGGGQVMFTGQARYVRVIERQHRQLDTVEHFANLAAGDLRPIPASWEPNRISAYLATDPNIIVLKKRIPRIRWTVVADKFVLHDDWSPYKHFTVVPFFPFFRRGRTLGLVENLLGPQELLNKVSSQELHVVNTSANSGWKVKTGALKNMNAAELEQKGAQTGLVIELDEIANAEKINPNQTPSGLDRISYKAEEHIKTISGVSDYRTGNAREDVAAKAVKANQAASSANTAKVMDNLQRTDNLLARNILALVQEFYTEERVVNIVSDRLMNRTETITVNQPDETGGILNDLTMGEYDVVVTTQPERDTFEDSQFEHALQLRTEAGIQIPDKFLIRSSRLKDKNEIIEEMEAAANDPAAAEKQALEMRGMEAEVANSEAEVQQKQADAQKKLSEANKPGADPQAELQMKLIEMRQEFELKRATLAEEMAFEREKFQEQMKLEREKADMKMAVEQQLANSKQQVMAATAAATIKTADAKATAMQKDPAAAAGGAAQPTTPTENPANDAPNPV